MRRWMNVTIAILALILGGFLYAVLRQNTYIAAFFSETQTVISLRKVFSGIEWQMASYYLPDFLWGLALSCSLIAIFEPSKAGCGCCALTGMLCGIAWEVLQAFWIVSGTGDMWDVLMYACAAAIAFLINIKERRK